MHKCVVNMHKMGIPILCILLSVYGVQKMQECPPLRNTPRRLCAPACGHFVLAYGFIFPYRQNGHRGAQRGTEGHRRTDERKRRDGVGFRMADICPRAEGGPWKQISTK